MTAVEEGYRAGFGLRMMASAADSCQRAFVEADAPQLLSVRQVVIDRIEPEADGVVSLSLTDPDGVLLPGWTPGAHLDVILPSGRRRQYSLNSDPADRGRYRIAVRRIADGGGSKEIHERLRVGDRLSVRGVRNTFPFVEAQQYLFVAGGIGIAPILSLVYAAERAGTPWRLMYFGRCRARMPFLCELARLIGGDVVVRPDDEFGRPNPRMIFEQTPTGATVYVCAPSPLAESARQVLSLHDPTAALYTERFAPVS
ncbi:ferredoxin reductase [Nocardia sp. NPDC051756]|uniref:ferredoxin reductase n=1 Tax=Nocardia sp. NPDC051756 TaxID=3154751 RepID=UPI003427AC1A